MKSMAQTLVQSDKLKVSCTSPIYSKGSCALRQYGTSSTSTMGKIFGVSIRARNFGYNVTFVCASARPPAQNTEFKQRRRVRHKARILSFEKGKMLVLHVQHEFPCISLPYSTKQEREITKF